MLQSHEYADDVKAAAKQYVAVYNFSKEIRDFHLTLMRDLDRGNPQLADCIDVLLFEQGLVERAEYDYENDNWHDDARFW